MFQHGIRAGLGRACQLKRRSLGARNSWMAKHTSMKVIWCWRCRAEVRMLGEAEWGVVAVTSAGTAGLDERTVARDVGAYNRTERPSGAPSR